MAKVFKQGVNIVVDYGQSDIQIPSIDTTYQLFGGLCLIIDTSNIIPRQEIISTDLEDAAGDPVPDLDTYLRTLLQ